MLPVDATLVGVAGALHFCQLPGTWFLGKRLLGIDRELSRLSPLVGAIMLVLGVAAVTLLVSLGAFVVVFANELVRSVFGRVLCVFLGVFWWARLVVQIYYYRYLPWPRSRAGRVAHVLLTSIFATQAIAYLTGVSVGVVWGVRQ
jgi:hypothetical protein